MWRLAHRGVHATRIISNKRTGDRQRFALLTVTTSARALAWCVVMMMRPAVVVMVVVTPTRMALLAHGPFPFRLWTPALGHATPSPVGPPFFPRRRSPPFFAPARSWRRRGRSGVVCLLVWLVLVLPLFSPSKGRLPLPAGDALRSTQTATASLSLPLSLGRRNQPSFSLFVSACSLCFLFVYSFFFQIYKRGGAKGEAAPTKGRAHAVGPTATAKNTKGPRESRAAKTADDD